VHYLAAVMFVRWQQIKRGGNEHWGAVLVSSARVKGKPKQTHIGNLGWILKTDVPVGAGRTRFWAHVLAQLEALGVPAAERFKIEAAVALRVPRPTATQLRAYARSLQHIHMLEVKLAEARKRLQG
jgi:hypothetical protein